MAAQRKELDVPSNYRVVGAVAVVKTAGTERYLSRGAVLPSDVAADHVAHLVSVGLVEEVAILPDGVGGEQTPA